nr:hypothetical protein [Tanacetum cinerariifolium]
LLAVGTPSTGSGNLYCQWELSPGSGNALCILFPTAEAVPEMAPTTLEKVNTRVIELAELHEHDTQDLYALLKDAQDGRTRISQWVAMDSQRAELLALRGQPRRAGQSGRDVRVPNHHDAPRDADNHI